jgi:membrane-bound ClpP family serine protease
VSDAFRRYLIAQIPDVLLAAILVWVLYRSFALPAGAAVVLLALWIAKDIALYRPMRRFYQETPAARRIVGESGVAVTPIGARGLVRVHGELWQARAAGFGAPIPEGAAVRVRDIEGLPLLVDRSFAMGAPPPAA